MTGEATTRSSILCFGEALWDVYPRSARPGGAPLNVAVHLRRLGRDALPVSAVGTDTLGDRLLAAVSAERLPIRGIARSRSLPTGRVDVALDGDGAPQYTIGTPAAWDEIVIAEAIAEDVATASAVVFGSLAQRSRSNRAALDDVLSRTPDGALRILDVNLRPPFVDIERLLELARLVDLIKVNRDEIGQLSGGETVEELARSLSDAGDGAAVCVTLGAEGAAMLSEGRWTAVEAPPVDVVDTVGAGDAFLASLLDALLDGVRTEAALARATRYASGVTGIAGAW